MTGTLTVSYTARNSGNTRLSAKERVDVHGPLGIRAADAVASTVAELLPGASVHRQVVLNDVPPLLALTTRLTLTPTDLGDNGGALAPVAKTFTTAAVPWLAAAMTVLLVAVLWWLLVRRRRRWRQLRTELEAVRAARTPD